jgi:iron(III) transport system ATP-binding protein
VSTPAEQDIAMPGWGRRGTAGAAIPAELVFENVSQRFGDVLALDDVSLTVAPGEVLCLLGASGCGKTSLLRIAAGVDRPGSGRVTVDGREVAGPARFVEPDKRGIGLMFQDYALFPHLSVLDNVRFGLRELGRSDARAAALRALARVGLERLAGAFPHMLSGGEQQRVALARAVAPRPGVLLMDEPFSNLDQRLRDAVRGETLALLREMGATAIIVTHDPEDAMRIADRIVLMRRGRIVQVGTAQEVYTRPASLYAARFFCDFNELPAIAHNGGVDSIFGRFSAGGARDGAAMMLCIRPSSLVLDAPGPAHAVPGRVLSRRFLGEVDVVEVAVEGLEKPLVQRVRGGSGPRAGADVSVSLDASEVLVFAAADA